MVKVCFIISGLGYSGAEIVLERYLKNNKFVDPYFIIIYKNSQIINDYKNKYKNVFFINEKLNFFNTKIKLNIFINNYIDIISEKLTKIIEEIKPQIIYSNNTVESMLASNAIYKNNIPSVAHIHDMKESFRGKYKKEVITEALRKYDRLITVSRATERSWCSLNFDIAYNGLNEEYFNYYNKKYSTVKKIGFVGSLNKRKGIDILIKNLNRIIHNNYKLTIVTTDVKSKYYNRLKTNKHIDILTNLNQNEVREFMKEIDILVVPSRLDPLPTIIMEAMAVGTLVVGNNIDSIREMIEDSKLLYSDLRLYEKIDEISKMTELQLNSMSLELKNISVEKFKDSDKKSKINNILRELLII